MSTMIPEQDREVLRYCGAMGHPFVVLISDGLRRCAMEANTKRSAVANARAGYAKYDPAIYQQTAPGEWRPVRFKAAKPPVAQSQAESDAQHDEMFQHWADCPWRRSRCTCGHEAMRPKVSP